MKIVVGVVVQIVAFIYVLAANVSPKLVQTSC